MRLEGWPRRAAMGALRVGALCVSAASGLALAAHLAVSSGGLPLGVLLPAIEAEMSARSGAAVALGSATLTRAGPGAGGPVQLVLGGAEAASGGRVAVLPDLRVTLDTGAVLRGQALPRRVALRGARVMVVRTAEGLSLSGGSLDLARLAAAADARGFEGVRVTDAGFAYRSELSGAAFTATGAMIAVTPAPGGYAARAVLPMGDGRIVGTALIGAEGGADLTLDAVPASVLSDLLPGAPLRFEDAALSGTLALSSLDADGAARFDLALSEGTVRAGLREVPLRQARAVGAFDLGARRLTLDEARFAAGESAGALSGTAELSGAPAFDLSARALTLALPGYEEPMALARAAAAGRFADGALALDAVSLTQPGGPEVSGSLTVTFGQGAPGWDASVAADGPLTLAQVRALWPDAVAPLTKRWVANNVAGGAVTGLRVETAIPPGYLGRGRPLETDMLDLRFGLADASVTYLRGMPPSVGARAEARLTGTTFDLTAEGGTVGGAAVETASFRQPRLGPQNTPVEIAASLTGSAQDLLAVADAPPLGYLGRADLSPDDFAGEGTFAFTLRRPLGEGVTDDQVEFAGQGAFDALGLTGLPAGIVLSGGRGTVEIGAEGLEIAGAAQVLGVPATGRVTRRFARGGAGPSMRLEATAALTPRDADALGLPMRRFARGAAPAKLVLDGKDRFETARLSVDLTDAALDVPVLGIDKAAGSHGAFDARLVLPEEGGRLTADSLRLATPDVLIEGSARWDEAGGIAAVDLPRVFSDGALDLSATVRRGEGGLTVSLEGRHADANGLVDRMLGARGAADGAGGGLPVRFDAKLDAVTARGGAVLTAVDARGRHDGTALDALSLSAGVADGGRLSFEVAPDAGGVGREVRLATDRSGALMTALFGIDSVTGGDARLDATAIAGGPLTGRFEADGIVLRDAPLVARLLSVGSLDGLANAMSGEGLAFDKLSGALTLEDGTLTLADARMTGSALGVSANGQVDLGARRFDLSGAVAPAYGVNSLLGSIPLLGDLFVSREGEGVVAFSYGVTGPIGEPTVTVNTLSALAPGVFRRIFEPIRPERRTPEELLEAATEAAALREDRGTARDAEELAREEEALDGAAATDGP